MYLKIFLLPSNGMRLHPLPEKEEGNAVRGKGERRVRSVQGRDGNVNGVGEIESNVDKDSSRCKIRRGGTVLPLGITLSVQSRPRLRRGNQVLAFKKFLSGGIE